MAMLFIIRRKTGGEKPEMPKFRGKINQVIPQHRKHMLYSYVWPKRSFVFSVPSDGKI